MSAGDSFLAELRRRNVLRAAVLYIGAAWALAQGIAQLGPSLGAPEGITRWFLIAAAIGFPFWLAFAWFYEWTPQGLKRESEIVADSSIARSSSRKLDRAIIAVLAVAVVLLASGYFVKRGAPVAAVAGAPQKSIAVLPLANESANQDDQYFSDGLSQDLITALTQFEGLKVISRDSAFQFRGSTDSPEVIAAKLGVAHLLEGSVQHQGDAVRISVTLVNASDGSTLWAQRYDKPYKDLFALQDAITQSVADELKAKLLAVPGAVVQSERPPSGNLAAWQAYQQGRFYDARATQAGHRKALDAYTEATRLDPRYAAAYARMTYGWVNLGAAFLSGASQVQAYAKARSAADTALQLAPDLALTHGARAAVLLNADFDWRGAQTEYQRAAQLAPNDPGMRFALGRMDATLGRVQSAVTLIRKSLADDPLKVQGYHWLGIYLAALGRLDEARQATEQAIELQPAADTVHARLAQGAILRGDAKAALADAQQESAPTWRRAALALATQIGPDRKAADAALQTLIAKDADHASFQIAEVYALRRDPDATFQWLDRAWNVRDSGIQSLLYDPFILRYRDDPRFAAFCKKVGLPATTDAVGLPWAP